MLAWAGRDDSDAKKMSMASLWGKSLTNNDEGFMFNLRWAFHKDKVSQPSKFSHAKR